MGKEFKITELENEVLKIVPLQASDLEELYEAASDPLIWQQHPCADRYKREVFELFFEEACRCNTAFKIVDKATSKAIGSSRYYDYRPQEDSIAIGFTFLSRQYWGGKYNGCLKQLMIDYSFQFVSKVIFHVGANNIRSQKAICKTGAKKSGEFSKNINGTETAHFEYCIYRADWQLKQIKSEI